MLSAGAIAKGLPVTSANGVAILPSAGIQTVQYSRPQESLPPKIGGRRYRLGALFPLLAKLLTDGCISARLSPVTFDKGACIVSEGHWAERH